MLAATASLLRRRPICIHRRCCGLVTTLSRVTDIVRDGKIRGCRILYLLRDKTHRQNQSISFLKYLFRLRPGLCAVWALYNIFNWRKQAVVGSASDSRSCRAPILGILSVPLSYLYQRTKPFFRQVGFDPTAFSAHKSLDLLAFREQHGIRIIRRLRAGETILSR